MSSLSARVTGSNWADGRTVLWSALLLGLAIRLVILSSTSGLGTTIVDEQHYTQLAKSVMDGQGLAWGPGRPTSIRPPLYPGSLAATWTTVGSMNLQAVRFLQILIALLTTALVYVLGRLAFGPAV